MHGRFASPWILVLAFGISRALLGSKLILDPGLALFEDDFLLSAREWSESGRLYPNWGPVLPGLLRLFLGFGLSDDATLRLLTVGLWQLLMLGVIFSFYKGLCRFLSQRTATLTTLLLILDPSFATPSFHVATEAPYLALLWTGFVCWLHVLNLPYPQGPYLPDGTSAPDQGSSSGASKVGPPWPGQGGWSLLSGFFLGLSALTRGNGLLVLGWLVLLTGGLGIWHLRVAALASQGKRLLLSACIMGGVGAMLVSAWSAKNLSDYGHFAPTSSGDHNIAVLWIGPARARSEGQVPAANLQIWADRMSLDGWSDPFARAASAKAVALEWAQSHPLEVLEAFILGQLNTVLGPGRSMLVRFSPLPTAPLLIWTMALRALCLGWLVLITIAIIINNLLNISEGKIFESESRTVARMLRFRGLVNALPPDATVYLLATWGLVVAHVVPAGAGGYARFFFPVLPFLYGVSARGLHALSAQSRERS